MRLQVSIATLCLLVFGFAMMSSAVSRAASLPDAVTADAMAEYDAMGLADSDAALDESEELADSGEHELSAHEAEELEGFIDSAVDAAVDEADAVAADEEEVDLNDESDAEAVASDLLESEGADSEEDIAFLQLGAESESEAEADAEAAAQAEAGAQASFGPFQAAANVMPYNMAVDPGHNFMNPFIRGYNPAYDGYTPQPGGYHWNNPNGPYWSPFHWSAPASYWSVYPPQYASHYVNPGLYHAPGMHQFFGPNYYGGHAHRHGPDAAWPYGGTGMHSMDPHVFGPHLDWPFGALTSDMDHVPGMGTGINPLQRFPQFIETSAAGTDSDSEDAEVDSAEDESDSEEVDSDEEALRPETEVSLADLHSEAATETVAVDDAAFDVDANNHVTPLQSTCVNCAYSS